MATVVGAMLVVYATLMVWQSWSTANSLDQKWSAAALALILSWLGVIVCLAGGG